MCSALTIYSLGNIRVPGTADTLPSADIVLLVGQNTYFDK
jgi:hypothetical protein